VGEEDLARALSRGTIDYLGATEHDGTRQDRGEMRGMSERLKTRLGRINWPKPRSKPGVIFGRWERVGMWVRAGDSKLEGKLCHRTDQVLKCGNRKGGQTSAVAYGAAGYYYYRWLAWSTISGTSHHIV
jgi:hypothetical protein